MKNHIFYTSNKDADGKVTWFYLGKVAACFVALVVIFEMNDDIFQLLYTPLEFLLGFNGTLHEWDFRCRLDHYCTWFGIVCAVYLTKMDDVMVFIEASPWCNVYKGFLVVTSVASMALWSFVFFPMEKYDYNAIHPFISIFLYLSYMILRNIKKSWRQVHSGFLKWMGKVTLETYIFQYHLYMIYNSKANIITFKGFRLFSFTITSIIFVYLSKVTFDLTETLNYSFIPSRGKDRLSSWDSFVRMTLGITSVAALYGLSAAISFA